jgi:hypothetical protein
MTYRIWKYPLDITDRQHVTLPVGAHALSVLVLEDQLFLYAFVDPSQPTTTMTIRVIGTGNPVEQSPGLIIGTVSMPPFVWHVFKELS